MLFMIDYKTFLAPAPAMAWIHIGQDISNGVVGLGGSTPFGLHVIWSHNIWPYNVGHNI